MQKCFHWSQVLNFSKSLWIIKEAAIKILFYQYYMKYFAFTIVLIHKSAKPHPFTCCVKQQFKDQNWSLFLCEFLFGLKLNLAFVGLCRIWLGEGPRKKSCQGKRYISLHINVLKYSQSHGLHFIFFYWSSHKMEAKHCEFELGKYNCMFCVWKSIIP